MQAIRVKEFGEPDVLKLADMPDLSPGDGQVVVSVKAVGVNPYEAYIRAGTYPTKPPLPYTPGADAAGVVAKIGKGVSRVKPGDRVYTVGTLSGAYAEQTLCAEEQVFALPDRISFAQGATLNVPYNTAYRGVFHRGQVRPGETVLIHGATGGVGLAAVQLAAAHGAVVIGTGSSEAGRELVRSNGAKLAVDHSVDGYLDEIRRFTNGRGVDVVLEMLANVNLAKDLSIVAPNGRIVVIGSRGSIEIDPRAAMGKEASILGLTSMARTPAQTIEAQAHLFAGLSSGVLTPVVGLELPLARAAEAHRKMFESPSPGKIVLTV